MTTATPETEKAPLKFANEMHEMQFKSLSEMIVKRNSLVGKSNAANGDRQTLTEQIRENSTDPEIVEVREALSELVLKLDALVKPQVDEVIANASGSVEGIDEEIKEIDGVLKPGLTYFKKLYTDGSADHFPAQERIKGTSVRSSGGTGGRRIRGFNVVCTIDGESEEFENFASAAKYLAVDTQDLQKEFFAKAGTDVLKDVPDEVKLTINFTEVDADNNETAKEAFVRAYRTEPAEALSQPDAALSDEVAVEDNSDEDSIADAL